MLHSLRTEPVRNFKLSTPMTLASTDNNPHRSGPSCNILPTICSGIGLVKVVRLDFSNLRYQPSALKYTQNRWRRRSSSHADKISPGLCSYKRRE
ncbi:hypothetical protein PM082_018294 [Marasmius tenuissimus]|nr:hypothetical protein PM082_018294 [Marasmius tenuissimus]